MHLSNPLEDLEKRFCLTVKQSEKTQPSDRNHFDLKHDGGTQSSNLRSSAPIKRNEFKTVYQYWKKSYYKNSLFEGDESLTRSQIRRQRIKNDGCFDLEHFRAHLRAEHFLKGKQIKLVFLDKESRERLAENPDLGK